MTLAFILHEAYEKAQTIMLFDGIAVWALCENINTINDDLLVLCVNGLDLLTNQFEVVTELLHLAVHLVDEAVALL